MDFSLSAEEKDILLKTARERIREKLGLDGVAYPASTDKLNEICGAFVTIHNSGMLRGCIGNIIGRRPLIETIKNMAHAAAFEDPRFPPLSPDEFGDIDIEISVLSPLRKISSISEIEIGKHGIYMSRGYKSGVLLPQVATEQGWDLQSFVEHTCMKSGLPTDAWKDPNTMIEIFSAVIFAEK
ncbi:MAG: AmmeMemoRadiSam system protein A [Spirochaetales bacterium]|uniref:AmmeMemoRadiSam system protein A n=1 Tax=Candidatus Thalassospirochaeta sargassi TaxID=3119039 RepID=A0AAJ1IGB6_9SPIO|nr:AmmeMemoRadiSam system protein A [Spirochaetales bacterium]